MRSCSVRSTHTPAAAKGRGRLAIGPMPSMKPCAQVSCVQLAAAQGAQQQHLHRYVSAFPCTTKCLPAAWAPAACSPSKVSACGLQISLVSELRKTQPKPHHSTKPETPPVRQSAPVSRQPLGTPRQSQGPWHHPGCRQPGPSACRCAAARS